MPLVESDLVLGRSVLEALEARHIDVAGALWFYETEAEEWRLMLVLPLVDDSGAMAGYKQVGKVLRPERPRIDISLLRITVVGSKSPMIKALRSELKILGRRKDVRLTHHYLDKFFIEGAYIYNLN